MDIFDSSLSDKIIDLFPSSPFGFILYMIVIMFFGLVIIFYFHFKAKSKNIDKIVENKKDVYDKSKDEITFYDLLHIASNQRSSTADLLVVLRVFNERFSIDEYKEDAFLLFRKVLTHKNRHKKVFDCFNNLIISNNKKYENQLKQLEIESLKIG